MTGYESKKAAAQAKTIDEVNWADHEPNGLAQPAQEPASVTYKEVQDSMNALEKGNLYQQVIAEELGERKLYTAPPQPAQEPVAWITPDGGGFRIRFSPPTNKVPLGWDAFYTTPPQRPWIGLTEEDRREIFDATERDDRGYVAALVEAKLKEKNGL